MQQPLLTQEFVETVHHYSHDFLFLPLSNDDLAVSIHFVAD